MADQPVSNEAVSRDQRELLAPIVAVGVLLAFGGFVLFLLQQTSATETEWARAVYLFSGVEAIAFAAAGFFFGSEVQRKRAENAEERAESAEERVGDAEKEATREATKGRALADAVRAKATARGVQYAASAEAVQGAQPERYSVPVGNAAQEQSEWLELDDLANRLYPD